jgi:hypothetical protein
MVLEKAVSAPGKVGLHGSACSTQQDRPFGEMPETTGAVKVSNSAEEEEAIAIPTTLRQLFLLMGVGLAALVIGAQTTPSLTSQWSPGAIPGGGGIAVSAFPIVAGEPFTGENNSRSVQVRNGKRIVYESHSIVARDSEGRVATRTPESPNVSMPDGGGSVFVPAGRSVADPVAMVQMRWNGGGQLNELVMKNRIPPNTPLSRPQPLNACERESGHTRNYPNGETQQIEDLGERTIQNILTRGCRVTTLIPVGSIHNDEPLTITDDWWSSLQFRVTLLRVHHDPSGTDEIKQLDKIVRGEPDRSLFQPPPGYTIRDMDAEREQQERSEVTVEPGEPGAEMLAGAWEADNPFVGESSQMGILLKILANRRVPFHQGKVVGDGPEKIATLDVRVYQRVAGGDKGGWFSTNHDGGASWDGHRLRIEFNGDDSGAFIQGKLSLDIAFNRVDLAWTGSYTHNGVTKPIVLARPGASLKGLSNLFLGGWQESGRFGASRCVYIAQGSDGTLVAWRNTRMGPTINPSEGMTTAFFQEHDGDALGVQITGNTVTLQEGIYWGAIGGQPPRKFTGKLSRDESQIVGTWGPILQVPGAENQPTIDEAVTFSRMVGQSCWSTGPN